MQTKNEKIVIIAQHLTNDQEEIKNVIKEISKNWFNVQIDLAVYNLLERRGIV